MPYWPGLQTSHTPLAQRVVKKRPPALAKLSRPQLYGALPRERLFAVLDGYRRHPVAWIAAHPGAGKTTLVASYLDSRRLDGIWFQLDASDGDPATFFYYLKQAASALGRNGSAADLPRLAPEYLADLHGFARRFFRQLFGGFGRDDILVLDNAQELPEDSLTSALLATAFEEIPPAVNVIVISRVVPPTRLARLVANQKMKILGWDDVRFTFDETSALVGSRFEIAEAQLRLVQERCDGWVAGITLLMERASRSGDLTHTNAAGPLPAVFDYFAGLLFDQASERTRRTLMATACLPFLTRELATQVSEDPEAGQLLEHLYRRHLFVHRRDDGETTYSYHALFREFLLQRAEALLGPDDLLAIRSTSARLLRAGGFVQEAFELFAKQGAWCSVIALIEAEAEALIQQGRSATLRDWFARVPITTVERSGWLQYWRGVSWLAIDNGRARTYLTSAHELFQRGGDELGQASVAIAMIETYWIHQRDFDQVDAWRSILERALQRGVPFGSSSREVRALAALMIVELNHGGDGHVVTALATRLERFLDEGIDDDLKVQIGALLMILQVFAPSMAVAQSLLAKVDALASRASIRATYRVMWLMRSGMLTGVLGDYEEGLRRLDEAEHLAREHALDYRQLQSRLFRIWLEMSKGDIAEARRVFDRMRTEASTSQPLDRFHVGIAGFDICTSAGDHEAALVHATSAVDAAHGMGATPVGKVLVLQFSIIALIDTKRFEEAHRQILEARAFMPDPFARRYEAELLLIDAYRLLRSGDRDAFAPALRVAFDAAIRDDAAYYHRMTPHVYQALFGEALRLDIAADHVLATIRRFSIPAPSPLDAAWPWPVKVFTLGRFAIEVNGKPVAFGRKSPRRLLSLLKAMIAFGGRDVPVSRIADHLWPDDDADQAEQSFRVAVRRLRELLGRQDAVVVNERRVSLGAVSVWVDALALEQAADESARELDRAIALYRGTFLPHDDDASWALASRERLKVRFVQCVEKRAEQLEQEGALADALEHYRRAMAVDQLAEPLYQGEIRCLLRLGRTSEARAALMRLETTLSSRLGTSPSCQTLQLLEHT